MERDRINKDQDLEKAQEIKRVSDPQEFIRNFKQSDFYKKAYEAFFKGKKLAEDVTKEQMVEAFEGSENARLALIDYGEKEAHLDYQASRYPQGSQFALNIYIEAVSEKAKLEKSGATREEREDLDDLRHRYHQLVGDQLAKDKIVPNSKIGRGFARLILVDRGLDTFQTARVPEIIKIQRKYGI